MSFCGWWLFGRGAKPARGREESGRGRGVARGRWWCPARPPFGPTATPRDARRSSPFPPRRPPLRTRLSSLSFSLSSLTAAAADAASATSARAAARRTMVVVAAWCVGRGREFGGFGCVARRQSTLCGASCGTRMVWRGRGRRGGGRRRRREQARHRPACGALPAASRPCHLRPMLDGSALAYDIPHKQESKRGNARPKGRAEERETKECGGRGRSLLPSSLSVLLCPPLHAFRLSRPPAT